MLTASTVALGCNKDKRDNLYNVTGIEVGNSVLDLRVGEIELIKASAIPAVASQPDFKWSVADKTIATVNNGLVKL